MTAYLQIL